MKKITWSKVLSRYNYGDLIEGTVIRHRRFGIFLDIGEEGVLGLIQVVNFLDEGIVEKYPTIGSKITGVIIAFDENNRQIRLSAKPSDIADAPNWR